MATGLDNKLTGQIGEYLACAELGRRRLIATPFSGNVPDFDIVVISNDLVTIPIQVKTTNGGNWPSRADIWINIEIDHENKTQIDNGNSEVAFPDLIYICIALSEKDEHATDSFYILKKKELQEIVTRNYRKYMDGHSWKRPRNYKSLDCRYYKEDLEIYRNRWRIIDEEIEMKRKR